MPQTLQSRSTILLVVGLIFSAILLVGLTQGNLTSNSGTGTLKVDGETYSFEPTTCAVAEGDFVAAGGGTVDGQPFWINASADRIDIAVGTESASEAPSDDQVWLTSADDVKWNSEESGGSAVLSMHDTRDSESPVYEASLSFRCSPSV